jgi:hypothetical protein
LNCAGHVPTFPLADMSEQSSPNAHFPKLPAEFEILQHQLPLVFSQQIFGETHVRPE